MMKTININELVRKCPHCNGDMPDFIHCEKCGWDDEE